MRRKLVSLLAVALLVGAAGCNYPGVAAPTPFEFPSPNATLTEVFRPTITLPGGLRITDTPPPTAAGEEATAVPPSATTAAEPTETTAPPAPTATNTVAPTNTTAPQPTRTAPATRSGVTITASFMNDRPTIDGRLDEWPSLERHRITDVVFGANRYTGEEDLSARAVMFGWDEDFLFIAGRVIDDDYVQTAEGENIFLGDSLEILLDADVPGDYYDQSLNDDDYQLGISPGYGEPGVDMEAWLWYPRSERGEADEVRIGAMEVDDGYRFEIAIPWDLFDIDPQTGRTFGFAFSISDNDNPNDDVQQTMVSTVPRRVLTDPTTWGNLTLGR